MEWERIDEYAMRSDKGYTVCRVFVHGRWYFEAWMPKSMDAHAPAIYRAPDDNGALARAACLKHYQEMIDGNQP